MYTINSGGFFENKNGKVTKTLVVKSTGDEAWRTKNLHPDTISEYEHDHVEGYSEEALPIISLFKMFTQFHLRGAILDVGCGIGKTTPLYAHYSDERIVYIGLDPIEINPDRDYPFICAKIEDINTLFDQPLFDGFVLATSLDHMQDLRLVADTLKRHGKPASKVVLWVGLHDEKHLVGPIIDSLYKKINKKNLSLAKQYVHFTYSFLRQGFSLFRWLARRRDKLSKGQPLDNYHFHYFTETAFLQSMEKLFGRKIESLLVPGTNHLFVCLQIHG